VRNGTGEEQAVAAPINPADARAVDDPRAVMNRLTAAQNAHDLEGMLACFHEDYHSEQPLFPRAHISGNRSSARELIPPCSRTFPAFMGRSCGQPPTETLSS
jgi:hypothetical protein